MFPRVSRVSALSGRGFSRLSSSWRRYALARELMRDVGLLWTDDDATTEEPALRRQVVERFATEATDEELLWAHSPEHVARCWTVMMATLSKGWAEDDSRFERLFAEDLVEGVAVDRPM